MGLSIGENMGFDTCKIVADTSKTSRFLYTINKNIQTYHHETKEGGLQGKELGDLVLGVRYKLNIYGTDDVSGKKDNLQMLKYPDGRESLNFYFIDDVALCADSLKYFAINSVHEVDSAIHTTLTHKASELNLTKEQLSFFQSGKEVKDNLFYKLSYERGFANMIISMSHGENNYVYVFGIDHEDLTAVFHRAVENEDRKDSQRGTPLASMLLKNL